MCQKPSLPYNYTYFQQGELNIPPKDLITLKLQTTTKYFTNHNMRSKQRQLLNYIQPPSTRTYTYHIHIYVYDLLIRELRRPEVKLRLCTESIDSSPIPIVA